MSPTVAGAAGLSVVLVEAIVVGKIFPPVNAVELSTGGGGSTSVVVAVDATLLSAAYAG